MRNDNLETLTQLLRASYGLRFPLFRLFPGDPECEGANEEMIVCGITMVRGVVYIAMIDASESNPDSNCDLCHWRLSDFPPDILRQIQFVGSHNSDSQVTG